MVTVSLCGARVGLLRRRVANIYFTLVAALSLTPYSPVRCAGSTTHSIPHQQQPVGA